MLHTTDIKIGYKRIFIANKNVLHYAPYNWYKNRI